MGGEITMSNFKLPYRQQVKQARKQRTLRLPLELDQKLAEQAEQAGVSFNDLVVHALLEYVRK